jgi:hypothetical protein
MKTSYDKEILEFDDLRISAIGYTIYLSFLYCIQNSK